MSIILAIYVFLLGAAFGSFCNMLVYRLHIGQNIFGNSYCDHTGKRLKVVDLIPIISYIIFRGKCRECGEKLPLLYPIVELLNALVSGGVFYLLFEKGIDIVQICLLLVLVQVLFFLALYDYKYWSIPSRAYIPVVSINLILFTMMGFPYAGLLNFVYVMTILSLIKIFVKKSGFSFQEIFILASIGLPLSFINYVWLWVLLSFFGFIIGSFKIIWKHESIMTGKIQLFPLLVTALILVLTLLY